MASSGSGGAQYIRRGEGASRGKGSWNKGGGGGAQAGKRKTEPGVVSVQKKGGQSPGKRQSVHRPGNSTRRWKTSQQILAGSAKEGQGFALWRKQKVQLEYKKLQRKQNKKKTAAAKDLYADSYPEHLKHLYLAEEERLNSLERKRKPEKDLTESTQEQEEVAVERPKKKFKNKTANQKAKEEYEQVKRERAQKRKEAEENKRKREEAKELYMKKKVEAYKVLSAKTKKGQPNFNVQMEYLLKKIQSTT
ncbi:thyroid transcription factor 1-associated protein 26 [Mantella aurantiaca]